MMSFPLGIAWSKTHAFNVFVDHDLNVWVVEPQKATFTPAAEATEDAQYIPEIILM